MPGYISSRDPNNIDAQANSPSRHRRNWQRARNGALTKTIKTTAPITNGTGGLSLNIDNVTLDLTGGALEIKDNGVGLTKQGWATMKGDLLTYTGSAYARLPVGADGLILAADSTQTDGIKWTAAGTPLYTSMANTTVHANTSPQTFTGFSGTIPAGYLNGSTFRLFKVWTSFASTASVNDSITYDMLINGVVVSTFTLPLAAATSAIIHVETDLYMTTAEADTFYLVVANAGTTLSASALTTANAQNTLSTFTGALTITWRVTCTVTNSDVIRMFQANIQTVN